MSDIEKAIAELKEHTFCAVKADVTVTDTRRGIAPLYERANDEKTLRGFSVADRVIGKAAALLAAGLGASEVYGEVMSEPALKVLNDFGVRAGYGKLVPNIINRDGTDICPMEKATLHINDPGEALIAVRATLERLKN